MLFPSLADLSGLPFVGFAEFERVVDILQSFGLAVNKENIAANTFGTLVHDSLEELYAPLIGKMLTQEYLKGLKHKIPQVVENKFSQHLPGVNLKKGNYLLVYNVISKHI